MIVINGCMTGTTQKNKNTATSKFEGGRKTGHGNEVVNVPTFNRINLILTTELSKAIPRLCGASRDIIKRRQRDRQRRKLCRTYVFFFLVVSRY